MQFQNHQFLREEAAQALQRAEKGRGQTKEEEEKKSWVD